ncbi:MAG: N-acetyl-gamma-glutamyl-phosphate reductase [Chloroflexota bacterium]|nr:N-acetyl-gamma-glutamyl-phosphate reductase [Chloroflexota bacterium]
MLNVSIVGASGYGGGELLRLLLDHPEAKVKQVTSESNAGKFVHRIHPNLRKRTDLKFVSIQELQECDVLFLGLPHGESMGRIEHFMSLAPVIIDLSADFRLRNPEGYPMWYGHEHGKPELLREWVYGIPELHREEMKTANYISSAGCLATAAILGLYPLFQAGVVAPDRPVVIEGKTGSSGAGGGVSLASHHPERSGAMRSFKPTGHRHTAEICQELAVDGLEPSIAFSATSIEAVRGILSTSHVWLREPLDEREIWRIYRRAYAGEPFMRIVKESGGVYRYPEPKILSGTNYCDVGFELDEHSPRVVVLAALDNLMKGAAGQAVQSFNIRFGFPETTALEFAGLHPI